MKDKYWQWLKEKEKAVFKFVNNSNKWHNGKKKQKKKTRDFMSISCPGIYFPQVPGAF